MACAVMAINGMCAPSALLAGADRGRIASKPSMSGIWTSINTISNVDWPSASSAARPLRASVTSCPAFVEKSPHQLLVNDVVLGEAQDASGCIGAGVRASSSADAG